MKTKKLKRHARKKKNGNAVVSALEKLEKRQDYQWRKEMEFEKKERKKDRKFFGQAMTMMANTLLRMNGQPETGNPIVLSDSDEEPIIINPSPPKKKKVTRAPCVTPTTSAATTSATTTPLLAVTEYPAPPMLNLPPLPPDFNFRNFNF